MYNKNQSFLQESGKDPLWVYPLFFLISIIFLYVFSGCTTPLFNHYGGDSSIFMMMAKMVIAGKIPYVDFFDHKGPMLIFIEIIGINLHPDDRTGIFILQIINLTFIQILAFKCSRCFLSVPNSLTVILLALIAFSFTIVGGNSSEEYSIFFAFLSLFYTIHFSLSPSFYIKSCHLFVMGICGAITFWIRINNSGVVLACILFIFLISLIHKNYNNIKKIIIYFSLGFLAITVPILLYLIYNNALEEMIYATIIFNLKYTDVGFIEALEIERNPILHFIKSWIALLIQLSGTILFYFKTKNRTVTFLSAILLVICYFSTHIGPAYYHYMTLNLPGMVLGIILILYVFMSGPTKSRYSWVLSFIVLIMLTVYTIGKYNYKVYRTVQDDTSYINETKKIIGMVPGEDRPYVYAHDTSSRFWQIAGLIPNYKYFINQERHILYDPDIIPDIRQMLEDSPPKWIVINKQEYIRNKDFLSFLNQKYIFTAKTKHLELYHLKE